MFNFYLQQKLKLGEVPKFLQLKGQNKLNKKEAKLLLTRDLRLLKVLELASQNQRTVQSE